MTRPESAEPIDEQSLGELVTTMTRDLSALMHKEIELAKLELAATAKRAGVGAGFLGGAGVVGVIGFFFLSFAAAYGIAEGAGVDAWIGFICVAGLYLILAGALAVMGGLSLKKVHGPQRTIATVKDDLAWAKHPTTLPPDPNLEQLKASHR